jgi:hypothetical protein
MLRKGLNYFRKATGFDILMMEDQILLALARGQAGAQCRLLDPTRPATWEFSGFSQNGEDGIIDYLTRRMDRLGCNSYFVEIGAGNGMENNTSWLAFCRKWAGLMIDGDQHSIEIASMLATRTKRLDCRVAFVDLDNIRDLLASLESIEPAVFSLDIDGNDFHIMKALFDAGFRPGIVIVEYNSAFGPHDARAVKYDRSFTAQLPLSFGTSVKAWRHLFPRYGYRFVTTDTNGINAFFVRESLFDPAFLDGIKGADFTENVYMYRQFKAGWEEQVKHIKSELFVTVD